MTCGDKSCGCNCSTCSGGKANYIFERIVKGLLQITKVTTLIGLTLVLFDVHAGLKAQFEGMQAQQAMMMNAGAQAGPAMAAPSK